MPVAKPLRLRLFLEGEEFPVISAQVSINMNAPAAASIQVIPLDEVLDLKPRTMVHLFYLDTQTVVETKTNEENGKKELKGTGVVGNYRLMFAGEMIGFSFVKSVMSRAIILQCVDFSSYWDACHATAIEYGPFGNLFSHMGGFMGSNTSNFDDIVNQQQEKLVQWIKARPSTPGLTSVSGLAGGIIHMLEAVGGVPSYTRGVNDFFTVAELRCRILQQITAEENDNTAANLLKEKVFDQWLRNGLQNQGQQVTFRDLMKMLFQYIYYDVVPNPAPFYTSSTFNQTQYAVGDREKAKLTPTYNALKKILEEMQGLLTERLALEPTNSLETATPQTVDYELILGNNAPHLSSRIKAQASKMIGLKLQGLQDPYTRLQESAEYLHFAEVTGVSTQAVSAPYNPDTKLVSSNDPGRSAQDGELTSMTWRNRYRSAIDKMLAALETLGGMIGNFELKKSTATKAQRLRSQIIRPDCWFAAPPRCNVIFPEQYSQVTYDRIWTNEVTRSMVQIYNTLITKSSDQGAVFLSDRIVAPNVGLGAKALTKKAGRDNYRVLMEHEYHIGIVPRVEWLSNVAAGSGSVPKKDEAATTRGLRLTWASRIAMFHFFKYRFGPRTLNVAGRFNPNLVCGFPGAVILKPFLISDDKLQSSGAALSSDTIEKVSDYARRNGAPLQFVGMIVGLNHNVDQSGGTTSLAMTHVRKHQGIDDEFLFLFTSQGESLKRRVRCRLNYREIIKLPDSNRRKLLKLLADVTPQPGEKVVTVAKNVFTKEPDSLTSFLKDTAFDDRSDSSVENMTTTELIQKQSISESSYTECDPGSGERVTKADKVKMKTLQERVVVKAPEATNDNPVDTKGKIPGVSREIMTPKPAGRLAPPSKGLFGKLAGVEVTNSELVTDPDLAKQVFSEVVLHEDIDVKTDIAVPIEKMLMPEGWFSQKYSNEQIGKNIYSPFFGCNSIVDELQVQSDQGGNATSAGNPEGKVVDPLKTTAEIIADLSNEQSRSSKISVERALNLAAYLYGVVRAQGLDVETFIQQYTDRPIATLEDIFGSSDMVLSVSKSTGTNSSAKITIDKGTPGFHTFAVNPAVVAAGPMSGLIDDPSIKMKRVNDTGAAAQIPAEYDVRQAKRDKVMLYLRALENGPAFRG